MRSLRGALGRRSELASSLWGEERRTKEMIMFDATSVAPHCVK